MEDQGVVTGPEWDPGAKIVGRATLSAADIAGALSARKSLTYAILLLAMFVLSIGVSLIMGGEVNMIAVVPGAFFTVLVVGFVWYAQRRQTQGILGGKSERDLDHTYELDADGYGIYGAGSSARAEWRTLYGHLENDTAFLLLPNPSVRIVIPKRAFAPEDVPRVRALLAARVTKRNPKSQVRKTLILWAVLILAFLAIWKLLEPESPQEPVDVDEQGEPM